jgi:hypothetical protein
MKPAAVFSYVVGCGESCLGGVNGSFVEEFTLERGSERHSGTNPLKKTRREAGSVIKKKKKALPITELERKMELPRPPCNHGKARYLQVAWD